MNRCAGVEPAPWYDQMFAPDESGPIITDFPRHELVAVYCELAEGHDGPHADFLGEVSTELQVWLLWTPGACVLVCAHGCDATDTAKHPIEQDACTLLADHHSSHSWELAEDWYE